MYITISNRGFIAKYKRLYARKPQKYVTINESNIENPTHEGHPSGLRHSK